MELDEKMKTKALNNLLLRLEKENGFDLGKVSDGFHTFESLYFQRCVLFAALCNTFTEYSWKSHKHEDGQPCFGGGHFIVGIDTPKGSYTYHYKDEYWDLFKCQELEVGKKWDGHTDKDVDRLLSLAALADGRDLKGPLIGSIAMKLGC